MYISSLAPFGHAFSRRPGKVGAAPRTAASNNSGVGGGAAAICFLAFMSGGVSGVFFEGILPGAGTSSGILSSFFEVYIYAEKGIASALLFEAVYHAAVLFLSFSLAGAPVILAVTFFRGFTAAFSAASVIGLYGSRGFVLAVSAFGASVLISIPCFLILSVLCFSASCRLFSNVYYGGGGRVFGGRFFPLSGGCIAVSALPALYRVYLLPGIVSKIL